MNDKGEDLAACMAVCLMLIVASIACSFCVHSCSLENIAEEKEKTAQLKTFADLGYVQAVDSSGWHTVIWTKPKEEAKK